MRFLKDKTPPQVQVINQKRKEIQKTKQGLHYFSHPVWVEYLNKKHERTMMC